ncbi:hypothetical protein LCGC14_2603650 [marine sediment metagenome]|uniref:HD domain-containing protein n=1 Tax=marine sediment metagenome TaxID=412755 RepID=A0A0F9AVQ4_9ZZZZ
MNTNIVTYTGKVFDLLKPKPEMVCIEDIAHSLAYQCRYTGHVKLFYSVAQHCVLMAKNEGLPGDPLKKLLHDAAEAYIGDMARPWKQLLLINIPSKGFDTVSYFECKIQKVIGEALGVDLSHSAEVEKSDNIMLATEIRDLMPKMPSDFAWGVVLSSIVAVKEIINPWRPECAEERFLNTYHQIT